MVLADILGMAVCAFERLKHDLLEHRFLDKIITSGPRILLGIDLVCSRPSMTTYPMRIANPTRFPPQNISKHQMFSPPIPDAFSTDCIDFPISTKLDS